MTRGPAYRRISSSVVAMSSSSLEDDVQILRSAFGPRLRLPAEVRRPTRAEQLRDLEIVALTTTIPGGCQVEVGEDGRVLRAWLGGRAVSATQFWREFRKAVRPPEQRTASRVRVSRPRDPGRCRRARRPAAKARASPESASPEPPSAPASPVSPTPALSEGPAAPAGPPSGWWERTEAALKSLAAEVRDLRGAAGAKSEPAARTRERRRRPVAPRTVVPTELDRARADAVLKRLGWKRVH